jgi:hypothetical protein
LNRIPTAAFSQHFCSKLIDDSRTGTNGWFLAHIIVDGKNRRTKMRRVKQPKTALRGLTAVLVKRRAPKARWPGDAKRFCRWSQYRNVRAPGKTDALTTGADRFVHANKAQSHHGDG